MSDFRFKKLEKFRTGGNGEQMELSLPLPTTPTGKLYRWCPNEDCTPRLFLLGDPPTNQEIKQEYKGVIRRTPGEPGTTCPYCGQDAQDDEMIHPADIKAAKDFVEWAVLQDVGEYFEKMAKDFNRKTRRAGRGLFSIEMDVKRPRMTRPFTWREDLLRNLACDICGREYGVYAIGLFCPDCGGRNVFLHFQREAELINQQIALAQQQKFDGDHELAFRLLGNAHEDVLTAFEAYQKTIYRYIVTNHFLGEEAARLRSKEAIGNKFQNIERGKKLFGKLNIDPYDQSGQAELDSLELNIQKRHVVGHNLSLSDDAYAESVELEQPGTTVTLLAEEISKFAEVCGSIIKRLEGEL